MPTFPVSRRCHAAFWGRGWTEISGGLFSCSLCYICAGDSVGRHVQPDSLSRREMGTDKLWRDFFSDPSQWWDNRSEKVNAGYPDFKHKKTQQSLWVRRNSTPSWVESELAAMPRGTLHSHSFSWHVRLRSHAKAREYKEALNVFQQMQREGVILNKFTFAPVLNACANLRFLEEGRRVHEEIIRRGCESDDYVATCLVDMYGKCGSIEDAWSVFTKMRGHDVVSWNAMIGGYVKSGKGLKAMELFQKMQQEGVEPSPVTFVAVLNACASIPALEEGRHVHQQIIQRGCGSGVYVATCLVDMYAKCGSIEDAWHVFNKMQEHNVVSWNAMIGGYVRCGQGLKAMEMFLRMRQEGVEPDGVTFVGALNACASVAALDEGRRLHAQIIQTGYGSNVYVANCLVDMYAKCGSIEDARGVFNRMREHNVVSWNAMIGGFVNSGQGLKARALLRKMRQEGVEPDTVTFIRLLNFCASVTNLEEGRHVHDEIVRRGCESDVYVANCLVDMYAKCGSLDDARNVFRRMRRHDVVSWNALIGGCVKSGQGLKAIVILRKMQQEGVKPDGVTFVALLNACASVADLEEGRRVHAEIISRGCESDIYVGNGLVDMYAKCGSIEDAWNAFNKMRVHDVVSWNAMVAGCVQSGHGLKARVLLGDMGQEGVEPDAVTFVGLLNVCTNIAALKEGRLVHEEIIRRGFESDVYIAACLVDMYAKCGSIEDAWIVFNKIQKHDVVSWNAMIGGYAMHGHAKKAIELFKQMAKEGVEINGVTFTCLLSACSHGGLVNEGLRYFKSMSSCYNLPEHHAGMVDLLGRAGRLEEAEDMTKRMPVDMDAAVWISLLGSCRTHGNVEMAERAAKRCWELDPENVSGHALLSNIYTAAGKWDKSAAMGKKVGEKVWKGPGCTWINHYVYNSTSNRNSALSQLHINGGAFHKQST